jgi:hypothetical protein
MTLGMLPNKKLSLVMSFDPPSPQPPAIAAFLTFDDQREPCPPRDVTAELDGVGLAPSPSGTGLNGGTCQVGYYLTAPPPAPAAQSTLRVADRSGEISFTAARLLEPRSWTPNVPDGSSASAGEQIDFQWSTDSDGIDSVEADFVNGSVQQSVTPNLAGTTASVSVPSLPSGSWTLSISALVHAGVVSCVGAVSCSSQIVKDSTLSLTVP